MKYLIVCVLCLTMSGCMLDLLVERDGKETSVEINQKEVDENGQ